MIYTTMLGAYAASVTIARETGLRLRPVQVAWSAWKLEPVND